MLRCHESKHLLVNAQLIATGALHREESRFGLSLYRGDFPQSRDEWYMSILQRKQDSGI
ncbi:MAG: hypothetical protein IMW94_09390 [Thermoanaerobacter sp.]|nr:hypothetical protein [Thermoanaerobacter sp.]